MCIRDRLNYADGEKRYILAPVGVKVGDTIASGANVDIKPGNAMEKMCIRDRRRWTERSWW